VLATVPEIPEGKYNLEYRIVRPDGSIRWIKSNAFPIQNEYDQVYRIAGISEDITERKLVEAEIIAVRFYLNRSSMAQLMLCFWSILKPC
jgi:hypothetical protein